MAVIAVDAMGGDNAPAAVIDGARSAHADGVDLILVGDPTTLGEVTSARGVIPVHPASQVIDFDDDPARAIREKRDASVVVTARLVADGTADAMVSAGSTGAAMAAATFVIGRLPGVSRPGIASIFPTGHVVLDVGANLEVKAEHLLQFAVMGSALAQVYRHIERPRIGLLNIGEEPGKGRPIEREAHRMLSDSAAIDFVGNVEGRDIASDSVDVIVTDGFTGNVLLKTSEGSGRAIQRMVLETLSQPDYADLVPALMPAFLELRQRLSPESVGGAHLVGTRGVVVIAHGSSSEVAIANAIRIAAEGVEHGLVERVGAGITTAVH